MQDLIVVGAGILGAFHAFHALNAGLKVQMVERHGRPRGATIRNFGQVVPSGMDRKWQRLGRRSLEIYKDLQSKIDLSIRSNGSVYIASNSEEEQLLISYSKICSQEGYPFEVLNKSECLKRWPGLRPDYVCAGLFFPEEVSVEPRELIYKLIAYIEEQYNLDYLPNTLIQEIEESGASVKLRSSDGRTFEAKKAIICSGDEVQTLLPDFFLKSDLVKVQLQMLELGRQQSLRFEGNLLTGRTIRRYEGFKQCPEYNNIVSKMPKDFAKEWGIHILLKQRPTGECIIGDSHEYLDVFEQREFNIDRWDEVDDFMIEEAKEIFKLEHWNISRRWMGIYTQCKEQDILCEDFSERIRVVTGIGGKGMTASAGFSEQHIANLFELNKELV